MRCPFVLSFLEHVEILEPADLRSDFVEWPRPSNASSQRRDRPARLRVVIPWVSISPTVCRSTTSSLASPPPNTTPRGSSGDRLLRRSAPVRPDSLIEVESPTTRSASDMPTGSRDCCACHRKMALVCSPQVARSSPWATPTTTATAPMRARRKRPHRCCGPLGACTALEGGAGGRRAPRHRPADTLGVLRTPRTRGAVELAYHPTAETTQRAPCRAGQGLQRSGQLVSQWLVPRARRPGLPTWSHPPRRTTPTLNMLLNSATPLVNDDPSRQRHDQRIAGFVCLSWSMMARHHRPVSVALAR